MLHALTIAVLWTFGGPTPAGDTEPAPARVRAIASDVASLVQQERFDDAIAVLDEAEQTSTAPVYVYMRAVLEEQRGDCEQAVELYRDYLRLDVPEQDAKEAKQGLRRCGASPDETPPTPAVSSSPARPVAASAGDGASPPQDEPPKPRRWYADPAAGALSAAGLAGLGVGTGLLVHARAQSHDAADATALDDYEGTKQRARRFHAAGIATATIGAALLVGGIIRYVVVAGETSRTEIGSRLGSGQALGTLRWRF